MPIRIFLSPPHMGGREQVLVQEAFASNYIAPLGPMVDAFEREFSAYIGIPHCVALSSGTAAMHLALRELGVGPGDEVLASTLTFIASVSPVTFLGAQPVFMDCDRQSWCLDPELLAAELAAAAQRGKLPKVVIPTDLYGQACDLDRLLVICQPYGVPVVCDSAEAVGTRYKERHAGTRARAAVYSFNGNKIITTSGGGMLASDDKHLIDRARHLATQAREPAPHYEHKEIGNNYRMSNLLAAVGRGQLEVLDERVNRRRGLCTRYQEAIGHLPGVSFMPEPAYGRCTRWLTVIQLDPAQARRTPEQVRLALEADNIEARPVWKPMHLQPVFAGCRQVGGAVAEECFARGLCLPSGSSMSDADQERVIAILRRELCG